MSRFAFSTCSLRVGLLLVSVWLVAGQADAQLRVVSYNPTGAPAADMHIVLRSIGEHNVNGIAKPIDILLLQEQSNPSPGANNPSPNTQAFVSLLNDMYSGQGVNYSMSNRTGAGNDTQTLVYRTETVQLLGDSTVGSVSFTGQPRQTIRYQVRPVGYDPSANFWIYNSHFKASQGTDCETCVPNADRRNVEATAIRNNADALGSGTHIIYAGDFNLYTSAEPGWGTLTSAGNGQAHDPIDRVGNWHENPSFADVHTQSPCNSGCGAGGGMDDRFDFQLVTSSFLDSQGLSYIPGSYLAFGNNGSTFNDRINHPSNTITFPGVTSHTKAQILNALATVTDHIPVVVDYQVPAIMNAVADLIPGTLLLGQTFNLGVTVSNAANVVAAIGADKLTYSLTTTGSVSGSFSDQMAFALSSGNLHSVAFDTSTPGIKTGMITLASSSQQAANALIQIPVNYEVITGGPQPMTIAQWTFEPGTPGNPPTGSGMNITGISPALGSGVASGRHASAATTWDNPVGNGSPESFSSNNWAVGDYYQFQVSTTGFQDITLSFDQASSNTGPRDFGVFYSTTGEGDFTDTGFTYSVLANASPNPTWNSGTYLAQFFHSFDLSGFGELNDQDTIFLRLVSITNVSANGGTVGTGGTSRIDNVTIGGTPILDLLAGDFNDDGAVDAADYVVWRKNVGTMTSLPNDPHGGEIGPAQYETWAANFGATAAGSGSFAGHAVPEPSTGWLLFMAICLAGARRVRLGG